MTRCDQVRLLEWHLYRSHLEEVVEQGEQHGVVVGEDKEVDREQVRRGLEVTERVRRLGLAAALDVDSICIIKY